MSKTILLASLLFTLTAACSANRPSRSTTAVATSAPYAVQNSASAPNAISFTPSSSSATLTTSATSDSPTQKAGKPSEPGVCDGEVCGPSGAFTVADFPNVAAVDFAAFPVNPPRPYLPKAGGRIWCVAATGNDSAEGSQASPLATPERAVELAKTGDVILIADGEYKIGSSEYAALNLRVPGVTLAAQNPGQVTFRPANENVKIGIAAEADDLIVDGFVVKDFAEYGILFGRLESPQRSLVLKHLVIDASSDGIRTAVAPTQPNPNPVVEGLLLYDVWLRNIRQVGFNCGRGALQQYAPRGAARANAGQWEWIGRRRGRDGERR